MSGYAFQLPYYATPLRADVLETALDELTPKLLRAGALDVRVYRSTEDTFRFRQVIQVPDKVTWERVWNSEAFIGFRTIHHGWYQKPFTYESYKAVSHGTAPGVSDPLADAA